MIILATLKAIAVLHMSMSEIRAVHNFSVAVFGAVFVFPCSLRLCVCLFLASCTGFRHNTVIFAGVSGMSHGKGHPS